MQAWLNPQSKFQNLKLIEVESAHRGSHSFGLKIRRYIAKKKVPGGDYEKTGSFSFNNDTLGMRCELSR